MVILRPYWKRRQGWLMVELLAALALLLAALLPIAYSIASEKRLFRSAYQHAVAMEVVDGEMEILLAGEWKAYRSGRHELPVRAAAATNLPPGRLLLDVGSGRMRLEWRPDLRQSGGSVIREAKLP